MQQKIQSEVVEMKSLRAFLEYTRQENLPFLRDASNAVFWSYDLVAKELTVTEGLTKLLNHSCDEKAQFDCLERFLFQENENAKEEIVGSLTNHSAFDIEFAVARKDGPALYLNIKGTPVFESQKEILRYNGIILDISAKNPKETELTKVADQSYTLLENIMHAVFVSQDGKYQYANQRMAELTGYSVDELIGMNDDHMVERKKIEPNIESTGVFSDSQAIGFQEINIIKKDGSKSIVEFSSSLIPFKGKTAQMGMLLVVTEKKRALELANKLTYSDALTGLPNRAFFYEKVDSFIKAAGERGKEVALLFINLNHIKTVNDTFGHHAGEEVIKEAGSRLRELLPDSSLVARYGDDEFVAMYPYDHKDEVKLVSKKIISEVPLALSSEIKVEPTIGISFFPEHGKEGKSLLRFADIAMCQSKRNENRVQNYNFYRPSMMEEVIRFNKLVNDVQKGIELKQFYLVYQPKVWLNTGKLEGVEALIRWEHPEYGNISPMEFIPLAEKSPFIIELGDWVLQTAINDMQQKVDFPLVLNVNISMKQLQSSSFLNEMEALIERTGFPADRLNLEITESMAIDNIEETEKVVRQLKRIGFKISLDDFGTGYSSLMYLLRLPIDCMKIDRSFVRQLEQDESKKTLIRYLIEGVHGLNIEVLAEGIETREQLELLKSCNCEKGQGYYFSKPLPMQDLLVYIENQS